MTTAPTSQMMLFMAFLPFQRRCPKTAPGAFGFHRSRSRTGSGESSLGYRTHVFHVRHWPAIQTRHAAPGSGTCPNRSPAIYGQAIPVRKAAVGDARKLTTPAMSEASPSLPSGMVRRRGVYGSKVDPYRAWRSRPLGFRLEHRTESEIPVFGKIRCSNKEVDRHYASVRMHGGLVARSLRSGSENAPPSIALPLR
jgi:hypothetical protein